MVQFRRCRAGGPWNRCPDKPARERGPAHCGLEHPLLSSWTDVGYPLSVADVGEMLPAGDLAVIRPGIQRIDACLERADDALLGRPGVMLATWWLRCRGCDDLIHGPGFSDLPCPCGERHISGDVVGLVDLEDSRAWVCRSCFTATLAADHVPAPRAATEWTRAKHPEEMR